jgi:hypothetical protein
LRIELTRHFDPGLTRSLFGRIEITKGPSFEAISVERNWHGNVAGLSCVPAGFYYLEPHNGTKYQDTWALIGAEVSHQAEGLARSACVLHWSPSGAGLEGCISAGYRLVMTATDARLEDPAIGKLVNLLNAAPSTEKHYLNIRDDPAPLTVVA